MNSKKALLGVLLSGLFLYLAFRGSDWAQIWSGVKQADLKYVFLGVPVLFLSFFFRAVRWGYLLKPSGAPGVHSLFGAMMIGFMALNVLPLRLGEFIRAYSLGRREGLPMTGVFATVVVERIFDGFTVLLILVLSLFFLPQALDPEVMAWIEAFSYLAVAIYFAAILFLAAVKWRKNWTIRAARFVLKPLPGLAQKAEEAINSFATGLDSMKDIRLVLIIAAYSLLVWISAAMFYLVVLYGFQLQSGTTAGSVVGVTGSFFLLAAVALGVMIPSSPGFVGTFELACITALVALGLDRTLAESYALVVHACQFIPITLVGVLYLYAYNFSFREIKAGGEAAKGDIE